MGGGGGGETELTIFHLYIYVQDADSCRAAYTIIHGKGGGVRVAGIMQNSIHNKGK
jgi:hypothetical protein